MAKCVKCKKITPEEMSFIIDKGLCPYCGGVFVSQEIFKEMLKLLQDLMQDNLDSDLTDLPEKIADLMLDNFDVFKKGTLEEKVRKAQTEKAEEDNNGAPTRQGVMKKVTSKNGESIDASIYQQTFNEDADLFDSAVEQVNASNGEDFVVMENFMEDTSSSVAQLKAKAAQGAKFIDGFLSKGGK